MKIAVEHAADAGRARTGTCTRARTHTHKHTHTQTHRGTLAHLQLAELCSNGHSITVPIANRNWGLESEQHLAGVHDALAAAGGVQQYGAQHVAALGRGRGRSV